MGIFLPQVGMKINNPMKAQSSKYACVYIYIQTNTFYHKPYILKVEFHPLTKEAGIFCFTAHLYVVGGLLGWLHDTTCDTRLWDLLHLGLSGAFRHHLIWEGTSPFFGTRWGGGHSMASIWSKIFPCSNLTSDFAMLLVGTRTTSLLELSNGEFIPKVVITSGGCPSWWAYL